jgi:hypothetical protein
MQNTTLTSLLVSSFKRPNIAMEACRITDMSNWASELMKVWRCSDTDRALTTWSIGCGFDSQSSHHSSFSLLVEVKWVLCSCLRHSQKVFCGDRDNNYPRITDMSNWASEIMKVWWCSDRELTSWLRGRGFNSQHIINSGRASDLTGAK